MKKLMGILIALSLAVVVCGCASSRKIPDSEINTFKSVIDLYEAKYNFGMNTWWKSPESESKNGVRTAQFIIATNMDNVISDVEEFYRVSKIYCESNGRNFNNEDFRSIKMTDVGLAKNLKNYPANELIEERMQYRVPSFSCANSGGVLFQGYIVRRAYTTQSAGPGRGNDVIVWLSEKR